MQVKELTNKGLSYEIEITIPVKDINERRDEKLQEFSKTVKMAGFRPGKVPLPLMQQKYGKAIMGEVLESAVNDTSEKVLKDRNLRPALQPKIEVKSFDDGKDLVYTIQVEVLPKFEIADFKGAKLQRLVAKPSDAEITEALERIASSNPSTQVVEAKRASKKGDTVKINFKGRTADDNKEHPGMAMEGHNLLLGSGMFIPGFEDQLTGKKAGDKVEVKVDFPKNYGAKELAGRTAIFDVEIAELREPGESKIDDEFAKTLGLENLDALKKAVSEQLQQEYNRHTRMNLKKNLMDYLDEKHDFEVPAGMVDMELQNILRSVEMDKQQHQHDDCEEGCGHDHEVKISDKEREELGGIANRRVRLGLLLSEIGNNNKITVSDPELQRAVITEAQRYPGQERDVFDFYSKNRNALESLRAPLFEEKVVDYILELADVSEKEVSPEDLMKALDDEEEGGKKKASKSEEKPKKAASKKK